VSQGYPLLRDFLRNGGIRHVIMMGYAADMCLISTTAGYENISKDFNCFVVGDATLATFPANDTPAFATVWAILYLLLKTIVSDKIVISSS
jgi:nicotinamidase-related amidase